MAKPDRLAEVDHYRNRAGRTYEVLAEALSQAGYTRGVSAFMGKLRYEGMGTQLAHEVIDFTRKEIRRRLEYNLSRLPSDWLKERLDYLVPVLNTFCFYDYQFSIGGTGALEALRMNCIYSVVSWGAFEGLPGEAVEHASNVDEMIKALVALDVVKIGNDGSGEFVYLTKKVDPWLSVS